MTATMEGPATTGDRTDDAVPERTRAGDRLYALDALRFVAAAAVVAFHVIPIYAVEFGVDADSFFGHAVAQASRYGWLGPYLFFLISGFVICMSSWDRTVGEFVTSRITRLWPAYVFAIALTTTLLYVFWPAQLHPGTVTVLANLTMVQGLLGVPNVDTVYWTLLVELKFYVLFAIVVRFGLTYRRVVLFCVAWTATAVLAHFTHNELLAVIAEPGATYLFVGGIALYLMYRFGPTLLLWAMVAGSWILMLVRMQERFAQRTDTGVIDPTLVLALITACFVVMIVVGLRWTGWLRWRGLAAIGALTYPLYLIHFSVIQTALRVLHGAAPGPVLLGTAIGGAVLLSWLIARLVERPLSRPLRRAMRRGFDSIRRADIPAQTQPSDLKNLG